MTKSVLFTLIALAWAMVFVLSQVVAATQVQRNTIYLANGLQPTIQAAIDGASPGDTIVIPAGEFTLQAPINITNPLTLSGAGSDKTILRHTGGNHVVINSDYVKVENIWFKGLPPGVSDTDRGIQINNAQHFAVINAKFDSIGRSGVYVEGPNALGVISKSYFSDIFAGSGVVVYGGGHVSWAGPLELGANKGVFIEDSVFVRTGHAVASNNGSHYVFRYNEVHDSLRSQQAIDVHGLEYGSQRGSRSYEVYNNYVANKPVTYAGIWIRGGDGVIFNNDIRDTTNAILLSNLTQSGGAYLPYPAPDQITKLYIWGNTHNGKPVGATIVPGHERLLQKDRDFFEYEMPGYQPYLYPHPLALASPYPIPEPKEESILRKHSVVGITSTLKNPVLEAYTTDGKIIPEDRWAAKGHGSWISYDLGSEQSISAVGISWFRGYQRLPIFKIFVSNDSENWDEVYDGMTSEFTEEIQVTELREGTNARYVKIVGYGDNNKGTWVSILQVEIYGD